MNNFSDMLSKAKKMQDQMKEVQENIKKIEVEGIAGGNLVKVILKGDYEMKSIWSTKLRELFEIRGRKAFERLEDKARMVH